MFVFNLKINNKKMYKVFFCFLIFVSVIIFLLASYKLFKSTSLVFNNKDNVFINDDIVTDKNQVAALTKDNYANILEEVHKDIDKYVGQKISFSGYVYRVNGFNENQFVLARDMDIGNNQSLIVGFLCECETAKNFTSFSWVELTGEIIKSTYNNSPIPLIKVTSINPITKPEDNLVYPPDSSFVATSVIY